MLVCVLVPKLVCVLAVFLTALVGRCGGQGEPLPSDCYTRYRDQTCVMRVDTYEPVLGTSNLKVLMDCETPTNLDGKAFDGLGSCHDNVWETMGVGASLLGSFGAVADMQFIGEYAGMQGADWNSATQVWANRLEGDKCSQRDGYCRVRRVCTVRAYVRGMVKQVKYQLGGKTYDWGRTPPRCRSGRTTA